MKKQKAVRYALVASLFLHILLAILLWNLPAFQHQFHMSQNRSPVELISPEELKKMLLEQQRLQGQVVDQNEKAVNDEIPKDTKYLSRHNQVVQQETKAALTGKFQNKETLGGTAKPQAAPGAKKPPSETKQAKLSPPKKATAKNLDNLAQSKWGDRPMPSLQDLKPKFNQYQPPAPDETAGTATGDQSSASDDHLPDVKTGFQTMLSTREFVYFSYYSRIKDRLRQYWEPKIKEKVERIFREGRTIASTSEKTTKIVILLDKNGILVGVQVVGESGVKDLDDAAVEAFRAAAPFPNPPKGIVEPDGLIRIRWDFILEA